MKRMLATLLVCALFTSQVFAVGRSKAAYVGGTIADFNKRKGATEGTLDLSNERTLVFVTEGKTITVAYSDIIGLEYERAAKPRSAAISGTVLGTVGGALLLSPLFPLGFVVLPFAMKKKKKHFLTIAYKDAEGTGQALLLELGKNIEKEARAVISARSGKTITTVVDGTS